MLKITKQVYVRDYIHGHKSIGNFRVFLSVNYPTIYSFIISFSNETLHIDISNHSSFDDKE